MKPESRAERVESGTLFAITRIVLLYAVFAGLWVLLSDRLIGQIVSDPAIFAAISVLKGWAFVAVTSLLLFVLLRRLTGRWPTPRPEAGRDPADSPWAQTPAAASGSERAAPDDDVAAVGPRALLAWPFLLIAGSIVAVALSGVVFTALNHKNTELAQLQAIVGLKIRQIATWLREREGDAQFLSGSRSFGELIRRWREEGDLASRQYLLDRLREHQQIYGYQSIWVLDERGEAILTTLGDAIPELTPHLRAAARRAIAEGRVVDTDLYRDGDDSTTLRLDFVAPLPRAEGGRPGPAIVLRTNPDQVLYPLSRSQPLSSASAPIRLFRREGDQVVFLEGPRPYPDAVVRSRFPLADKQLLAARALRGEAEPGGIVEGVDDRGTPAVAAVGPVPGRDWFLLAELTRSKLYSPVERDALWIGGMALLALFAAAAATYLIDQRRALRFSLLQGRQQAEKLAALQQLANERVRLRTLVQTIPDLIWLKDPEGRYLACNPAFERFFGAKEVDIVGKTDYDFVSADVADFFRQKDQEAMAAGGPRVNEECISLAGTGRRLILETIKTPMWDIDGEWVGVLGIGRDITARKRAEEELRFQAMVLNQIEDKVTVTDLQGIVTYVNEAGCRHLKRSREELIGQPVAAYGDDPARGATQQQIIDATLAVGEWRGEVVNQAADGAESLLDCRTRVVRDEEGSPVALCGIATDITERKRTAAELERYRHHLEELVAERTAELAAARDEAEAANRAKSAFLSNMSHEIRTPMNAILGFAHLLRREVREAEGRRKVDKIVAAAEHLLGILNNVLDLSKIEAEKLALERVDFELSAVVEEARALVADKARAKGLALAVDLAPEAVGLGRVRGDPTRLRQMLLNYLIPIRFQDETNHGTSVPWPDHDESTMCWLGKPATPLRVLRAWRSFGGHKRFSCLPSWG